VFNPATGTLEIACAYRDEAAKALMREIRPVPFRLKLGLLHFNLRELALHPRRARSLAKRYFLCNFNYLLRLVRHDALPRYWNCLVKVIDRPAQR
jgi:hypothetical protein